MHYANGREAKVGDHVVGKTYNQPGIVAGTLVSLTPGTDACSAQVEYVAVFPSGTNDPCPPEANNGITTAECDRTRGSEQHGSAGPKVQLRLCRDYTHAGNLIHADDAFGKTEVK